MAKTRRRRPAQSNVQQSLFEDDFLVRIIGPLATSANIALTELVANAWDAGALNVRLVIPTALGEELSIEDDGTGMTDEEFCHRWMTLGYNRAKHQGVDAEFPPGCGGNRRTAYGRNGVGRHGLLCFGNSYDVFTRKDGISTVARVTTSQGATPFMLQKLTRDEAEGHGTRLTVRLHRNLPDPDRVRSVISARFVHDPRFSVWVNDVALELVEHEGLVNAARIPFGDGQLAEIFFLDSTHAARSTLHQGVALWVAGRLVGEPSWQLGAQSLIDGRTRLAKQFTAIVRADALIDHVLPDWTGLRDGPLVEQFYNAAAKEIRSQLAGVAAERIEETKDEVVSGLAGDLDNLAPLRRRVVTEFINDLAKEQPFMAPETMSSAARAFINMEKARSGEALMEKLAQLSVDDIEGLNRLLGDWSVAEALTVLDIIDHRIAVLEAIRRFSQDEGTRELETLHPLVAAARWLFGPEFDSSEYSSNNTLTTLAKKLFAERSDSAEFENPRRRPDLLLLRDASMALTAIDSFDSERGLNSFRDILIIELKRGRSTIGRTEMHQALAYVEEILGSGLLAAETPLIRAFVVGHELAPRTQAKLEVGERRASVQAVTYDQLVRTGNARLHGLRSRLESRYGEMPIKALAEAIERPLSQTAIEFPPRD